MNDLTTAQKLQLEKTKMDRNLTHVGKKIYTCILLVGQAVQPLQSQQVLAFPGHLCPPEKQNIGGHK